MSVYSYPESKAIDQVTFKTTANGAVRAYLHASTDADTATVKTILDALKGKGFECVAFTFEGKDMLEIRGFKREANLLSLLKANQWVSGKVDIAADEEKLTLFEKFKKRTLQLSGVSYVIGDIGLWSYGVGEKDPLVKAASIAYFLGTLSLIFYGRNDQSDLQVHDLAKDLEKFLAEEKIALPEGSALHAVATDQKKSAAQSLHEFGKRYPSEMFNTVTALAGVFMFLSSYKKLKIPFAAGGDLKAFHEMRGEAWMDLGLGGITAASGTFATVVKEKKHDPDSPPAKGFAWLWEKMREHPLAVAGVGYTIATLCHAGSTWKAWREAKRINDHERLKSVPMRGLFVGAALVSEFLLAISSKGHGEGVVNDASVDHSVIAIAAEVIARQPAEAREPLLQIIGKFLGEQKSLAMKDEEVIDALRKQVESSCNNPWVKAHGDCEAIAPPIEPETLAEIQEKPILADAWQAKMNAAKQQPAQLQSLA